ncbi:centrosomal protein of 44 kDa-like [Biomphalaria glabrata]|uniref:Centrosomal protein of 44 kDa n=1 Tax=Biomphalaria glabrata TaxID=6526 RepID=A0A9U8EL46_BIOGL|nr:centrosomal protein of 44 kDa-like [Biomphalaria glabrata]XP_055894517.1 centrosomal protein of 44 kDa-like [Biomphalaria glabrata]
MSTGDMKNNIKQLQHELKAAKYPLTIDVDGLLKGSPKTYLAIYHYLFTSYSTKLNKDIVNSNNELYGKSDMRFMEAVYKILRDMFEYKPQIHREQFFTDGYAERKMIMATDVLRQVQSRYKPLKSSAFKVAATKEEPISNQKVVQEPVETTRKIASKAQDFAGAVVLPVKTSGSFRIPKTVLKASHSPFIPSNVEAFTYPVKAAGEPIQQNQNGQGGNEKAFFTPGQSTNNITVSDRPERSIYLDVVPRVLQSMQPMVDRLTERLDQMDSLVQNFKQSQTISTSINTENVSPVSCLDSSVTAQINDLSFKLDTLMSRVILIENRLTLLEAKTNKEQPVKTSEEIVESRPPVYPTSRRTDTSKTSKQSNKFPPGRENSCNDPDERNLEDESSNDFDHDIDTDVQVRVVRAEPEKNVFSDACSDHPHFYDELHVDSCTNLNINPSSEVKAYSKKPGQLSDISNAALLETSSIQEPTSDTESSWYSTSQLDPALDTSTAQRVNRISQMLAETQKLFA